MFGLVRLTSRAKANLFSRGHRWKCEGLYSDGWLRYNYAVGTSLDEDCSFGLYGIDGHAAAGIINMASIKYVYTTGQIKEIPDSRQQKKN